MKIQAQFSFKPRAYKTVTIIALLLYLLGSFLQIPTGQKLALAQSDPNSPSERYIIFLDGVNSSSTGSPPLKWEFYFYRT